MWFVVEYILASEHDKYGIVWNDAVRTIDVEARNETHAKKLAHNFLETMIPDKVAKNHVYVFNARE